jgi:hypothetical protein
MPISSKIAVSSAYLFMIIMNMLAVGLPVNGLETGEISDMFENLFAPAGLTFSVWGIIYLLLGLYLIAIWLGYKHENQKQINLWFIQTSVFNGLWIFAWHYLYLIMSLVLMFGILYGLIKIALLISNENHRLKLIFHIYFGWITVAAIANVVTLLVDLDFNFLFSEQIWTTIIIYVGLLISLLTGFKFRSIPYFAVVFWAYLGILIKHLTYFESQFPLIIISVATSLFILMIVPVLSYLDCDQRVFKRANIV